MPFANAKPPTALAKFIMKTTHRVSNAAFTINTLLDAFIALEMMYLLVFIHLEYTISFSPSRYVKSLLPTPLSVPSPSEGRNERHYPRKFRSPADKNEYNVWARETLVYMWNSASFRNYVVKDFQHVLSLIKIFHSAFTGQIHLSNTKLTVSSVKGDSRQS